MGGVDAMFFAVDVSVVWVSETFGSFTVVFPVFCIIFVMLNIVNHCKDSNCNQYRNNITIKIAIIFSY